MLGFEPTDARLYEAIALRIGDVCKKSHVERVMVVTLDESSIFLGKEMGRGRDQGQR